jgi:ribose 5-phosphate isomerase A
LCCWYVIRLEDKPSYRLTLTTDFRKAQPRLLTHWPSIPIEVAPISAPSVLLGLKRLGSTFPKIRLNQDAKSGPLKTDQAFYIIDAPFPQPLLLASDSGVGVQKAATDGEGGGEGGGRMREDVGGPWRVDVLAERIKAITGVLEVGLFFGVDGIEAAEKGVKEGGQKPVAVYFGMEDGSVQVRLRKGGLP